ncbi:MAG: winged helix-turn-helix transcriptional regulator [Candidatus Thorarchaeota archaeon]|nr:winged helix-turn-helix transcriptional regulator [Candidatus Thorarchaeota archaeon]
MDAIDKALWRELYNNCRLSYQYLGNKLNISANAVKKRVDKLIETGIIVKWSLVLKPVMIDVQYSFVELKTDQTHSTEELTKSISKNPNVFVILPLTTGDFALHAFFEGAKGLLELNSFLRQIVGIQEVKVHPTTMHPGKKIELTKLHLCILKWLFIDPRMNLSHLAESSGLTVRRVRRIVEELVESDAFEFGFHWNPNAGDSMAFISRIEYDPTLITSDEIDDFIQKKYDLEYFYSHVSAIEPVMFSVFMVPHLFDMENITKSIHAFDGVQSVIPMIYYSAKIVHPLTETKLVELLADNDLWP